jgi:hypothetical protein
VWHYPNDNLSGSTWAPIPDLQRANADLGVLFLSSNEIHYMEKVQDPWFFANNSAPLDNDFMTYTSTYYTTVMGCTEMYRVCTNAACSSFGGFNQIHDNAETLKPNSAQRATLYRIVQAISNSNVFMNVETLQQASENV